MTEEQRDFLLKMADLMGKKTPGKIPGFVIRLVLGKDFYEVVNTNCKVSNQKAKKLLGWKPQYPSYQDGLYPTIKEMEHLKPLFE